MADSETYTNSNALKFAKGANSVFRFRSLMFFQIPLIWFSGIKVKAFDRNSCTVKLPFTRSTQNPFRSVYFAAQSMAAELSTGLILMAETIETGKKCAMLVTAMSATFIKKADATIYFTCSPNDIIINAIKSAIEKNEPVKFILMSEGKMEDGTLVASFEFEWSVKFKS